MTVSIGPASIIGYLLTALGAAGTAWASASTHPAINAETLLIVTIAAGALTNAGRQLQASRLPQTPETLLSRPESAVKPDPV